MLKQIVDDSRLNFDKGSVACQLHVIEKSLTCFPHNMGTQSELSLNTA